MTHHSTGSSQVFQGLSLKSEPELVRTSSGGGFSTSPSEPIPSFQPSPSQEQQGPGSPWLKPIIPAKTEPGLMKGEEVGGAYPDIGTLVADTSSDSISDDSGSWIQKIDVSNFKQLTANHLLQSQSSQDSPSHGEETPLMHPSGDHYQSTVLADHGGYAAGKAQQPPVLTLQVNSFPSPDDLTSNESPGGVCLTTLASPLSKKGRLSYGSTEDSPPTNFAAKDPETLGIQARATLGAALRKQSQQREANTAMTLGPPPGKVHPKPIYSYSCLIALSLKNSKMGRLTVAEIYNFMCENFPYFRTAPAGWKNSVRHNLSLNKCFEKIEVETPGGHGRKSCLWTLNPLKITKMDSEIKKWREKDPAGVLEALQNPEDLEIIERGQKGMPGEFSSYYVHSLPDVIPNHPHQVLLLRTAPGYNPAQQYNSYSQPLRNATSINTPTTSAHPGWASTSQPIPHRPPQPSTPPRGISVQAGGLPPPPHPTNYSTPHRSQTQPPSVNTASSPFAHTPPYSPNVHSPQLKISACPTGMGEWGSSTPRNDLHHPGHLSSGLTSPYGSYALSQESPKYYHQPQSYPSPFQSQMSPCKLGGGTGFYPSLMREGSYETANNALNNNSLLQTALTESPCRGSTVTLKNL